MVEPFLSISEKHAHNIHGNLRVHPQCPTLQTTVQSPSTSIPQHIGNEDEVTVIFVYTPLTSPWSLLRRDTKGYTLSPLKARLDILLFTRFTA